MYRLLGHSKLYTDPNDKEFKLWFPLSHTMTLKIFSVFALIFCATYVRGSCPLGWAEYKEDCLYFSTSSETWGGAETACRARGGWLASDDNQGKHDFITKIADMLRNFKIYEWYVGASDFTFEGQYRWVETGVSIGPFSKWGTGYPNGTTTNNCLALKWQGSELVWVDELCGSMIEGRAHHGHQPHGRYNYICEKANNNSLSVIGK